WMTPAVALTRISSGPRPAARRDLHRGGCGRRMPPAARVISAIGKHRQPAEREDKLFISGPGAATQRNSRTAPRWEPKAKNSFARPGRGNLRVAATCLGPLVDG